jgi:hydroxymethylglutaryl-CoA lyase
MLYPSEVRLLEVGMRDGFQMEPRVLPTELKIDVGLALIAAGVKHIEVTSFVSSTAVPQLADAAQVVARLKGRGARLNVLVPNVTGARRAVAAGVDRITVFVSASEAHNLKNVRRTIAESLTSLPEIGVIARDAGIAIGGAVATAFGCPYEGDVAADAVLRIADAFVAMGAEEIALGDTTGMATPPIVDSIVTHVRSRLPHTPIALHFHNTRGIGLVNVLKGLELGIDRFESSIGGLGGCPFAVGATGNICSEDFVYLMNELHIATGIDLGQLIGVAQLVQAAFGRELPGQVMKSGPRLRTKGN